MWERGRQEEDRKGQRRCKAAEQKKRDVSEEKHKVSKAPN